MLDFTCAELQMTLALSKARRQCQSHLGQSSLTNYRTFLLSVVGRSPCHVTSLVTPAPQSHGCWRAKSSRNRTATFSAATPPVAVCAYRWRALAVLVCTPVTLGPRLVLKSAAPRWLWWRHLSLWRGSAMLSVSTRRGWSWCVGSVSLWKGKCHGCTTGDQLR